MKNFEKPNVQTRDTARETAERILRERRGVKINVDGDDEAEDLKIKVEILQDVLPEEVEVSDFLRLVIDAYNPLNLNGKRDFQRMMIITNEICVEDLNEYLEDWFESAQYSKKTKLCDLLEELTGIKEAEVYNPYGKEDSLKAVNWILSEVIQETKLESKSQILETGGFPIRGEGVVSGTIAERELRKKQIKWMIENNDQRFLGQSAQDQEILRKFVSHNLGLQSTEGADGRSIGNGKATYLYKKLGI